MIQPAKTLSPKWYAKPLKHRMMLTRNLEDWLFDPSSLTAKLRQKCPELSVKILSEKLEYPLPDEQQRLKMAPGEKAWIRIVTLTCGELPLVYARTIIPNFQPGNPWFSLKTLGHTPLGHVLFAKDIKNHYFRSEFECQDQRKIWPYLSTKTIFLSEKGNRLASRRCEFSKKGNSLLLTEVFLPNSLPLFD